MFGSRARRRGKVTEEILPNRVSRQDLSDLFIEAWRLSHHQDDVVAFDNFAMHRAIAHRIQLLEGLPYVFGSAKHRLESLVEIVFSANDLSPASQTVSPSTTQFTRSPLPQMGKAMAGVVGSKIKSRRSVRIFGR